MQICWLLLFLNLHFFGLGQLLCSVNWNVMSVCPSPWHDCVVEVDSKQPLYLSVVVLG